MLTFAFVSGCLGADEAEVKTSVAVWEMRRAWIAREHLERQAADGGRVPVTGGQSSSHAQRPCTPAHSHGVSIPEV